MSQSNNKELEMAVGTSNMLESNMMETDNFYTPMETATEPESATQSQWTGVKNDTGQLCRVCANSSDYAVPIYEGEGLEHQLEFKIQKHLPIHVSITDMLPLQLCYQCASTLIAYDSMLSNCLDAEKKLKAMQEAAEEAAEEASKTNEEYDDSQLDTAPAADSDDEPLIQSKTKLLSEKTKATPIKKKILSKAKTRSVTVKTDKTATNSKEGEDKERSEIKSEEEGDVLVSQKEKFARKGRAITCELCNKRLVTKQGYIRHMKNHMGDRSQTCHICGKCFLEKKDISRHVREVHDKIKRFSCDVCGRSFATKNTRNDHRTTHTGERTYVCHICGKTFKTANCVYIHRRTHTDYAPHKCSSCNKSFRTRQRLNNHLAIHTGEKPFMCQVCGKRFITKSQVNCHVEIHSCNRPHVCPYCGVSYSVRKYLRVHVKSHHPGMKIDAKSNESK